MVRKRAKPGKAKLPAPKKTKGGQDPAAAWARLAKEELKGKSPDCLDWTTIEGIRVKALYGPDDLEGLETASAVPGIAPFLRGVRATMYAAKPWTIRQ